MDCCAAGPPAPGTTSSPYPMVPISDVLAIIARHCSPLPPQEVALSHAHGRVLASDVLAPAPVPPFRASMKDGYAVRAQDVERGRTFHIGSRVLAGHESKEGAHAGPHAHTCSKIMTGAALPNEYDCVIMVEVASVSEDGASVTFLVDGAVPGQDVRAIGSDVEQGQLVLTAGTHIGAAEIGLLACVSCNQVKVYGQAKVAIMSTGDELCDITANPCPEGHIRDSNRPMLLALLRDALPCAEVLDLGIAPDRYGELSSMIDEAFSMADVLISSGGVSMGDVDLMKRFLQERCEVHVGRVLMKPGKPLMFATLKDTAGGGGRPKFVFATPGNPVSSLVSCHMFAIPALRMLCGTASGLAAPKRVRGHK
eukprot:TRINITY_DN5766_c0_g1_i3.p1 TRINITY_DN5766_c0_g1~~TRINITY_DN5766_c0_g1_i3.p1  ORF type:complete len:367 (+),score=76.46 TRINITY_DN5766_c0_g1_i3:239-1339(+)